MFISIFIAYLQVEVINKYIKKRLQVNLTQSLLFIVP